MATSQSTLSQRKLAQCAVCLIVTLFIAAGCGDRQYGDKGPTSASDAEYGENGAGSTSEGSDAPHLPHFGVPPGEDVAFEQDAGDEAAREPAAAEPPPQPAEAPPGEVRQKDDPPDNAPAATVERRIIYEGTVSLVVDDFDAASRAVADLVSRYGGYLASGSKNRHEGRFLTGQWVYRVPAVRFTEFLEELTQVGVAERVDQTAQDVTMEYMDLEARIRTKKELEARILEVLADRQGELKDVLEAERELARVRSEIETMEGRLRYLRNRTTMSTVTVTIREEKDYVPPTAPTFGGRVVRVWGDSWSALREAGINLALAGVSLTPWLPPLAVIVAALVALVRFASRRMARRRTSTTRSAPH